MHIRRYRGPAATLLPRRSSCRICLGDSDAFDSLDAAQGESGTMEKREDSEKAVALDANEQGRRAEWVTPEIRRTRAGDAEAGINPVMPEGAFGFGS